MPAIGHRPVDQVEPHELLAVLKRQADKGNLETARRTRAFASRVFRYAVATTRAKRNIAADLQGALTAPTVKHHAAVVDPKGVGALLRAIDGFDGQPVTMWALRLSNGAQSGPPIGAEQGPLSLASSGDARSPQLAQRIAAGCATNNAASAGGVWGEVEQPVDKLATGSRIGQGRIYESLGLRPFDISARRARWSC